MRHAATACGTNIVATAAHVSAQFRPAFFFKTAQLAGIMFRHQLLRGAPVLTTPDGAGRAAIPDYSGVNDRVSSSPFLIYSNSSPPSSLFGRYEFGRRPCHVVQGGMQPSSGRPRPASACGGGPGRGATWQHAQLYEEPPSSCSPLSHFDSRRAFEEANPRKRRRPGDIPVARGDVSQPAQYSDQVFSQPSQVWSQRISPDVASPRPYARAPSCLRHTDMHSHRFVRTYDSAGAGAPRLPCGHRKMTPVSGQLQHTGLRTRRFCGIANLPVRRATRIPRGLSGIHGHPTRSHPSRLSRTCSASTVTVRPLVHPRTVSMSCRRVARLVTFVLGMRTVPPSQHTSTNRALACPFALLDTRTAANRSPL